MARPASQQTIADVEQHVVSPLLDELARI